MAIVNDINMIAALSAAKTVLANFSDAKIFIKSDRRFMFEMKNRSPVTFILEKINCYHGYVEAPGRELGPAQDNDASELRIRGYKAFGFRGVQCTLHFRIVSDTKDTGYRLHIFLQIAHILSQNYFGWYISGNSAEEELPPEKWYTRNEWNRDKTGAADKVLNKGDRKSMGANFHELGLHIEMFIDNLADSTPSMIISALCK